MHNVNLHVLLKLVLKLARLVDDLNSDEKECYRLQHLYSLNTKILRPWLKLSNARQPTLEHSDRNRVAESFKM